MKLLLGASSTLSPSATLLAATLETSLSLSPSSLNWSLCSSILTVSLLSSLLSSRTSASSLSSLVGIRALGFMQEPCGGFWCLARRVPASARISATSDGSTKQGLAGDLREGPCQYRAETLPKEKSRSRRQWGKHSLGYGQDFPKECRTGNPLGVLRPLTLLPPMLIQPRLVGPYTGYLIKSSSGSSLIKTWEHSL